MRRLDVVISARRCVGTPFQHGGRLIGFGLDCLGMIFETLKGCNYPGLEVVLSDKRVHNYRSIPKGELYAGLNKYCTRKPPSEARPGDILIQWVGDNQQHVMFFTERGTVIHATDKQPWMAVVEQRLLPSWKRNIINAFELPGITD